MAKCKMEGCSRAVKHRRSGLCGACYAFVWYWKNKSVTEIMQHSDKLHFWAQRVEQLPPTEVTRLPRRKSRA